jgi:hypothetical protein
MITMIPNMSRVPVDVVIARETARVAMFREAYETRLSDLRAFTYIDANGTYRHLTPLEVFENVKSSFDDYMFAADRLGCLKRAYRK